MATTLPALWEIEDMSGSTIPVAVKMTVLAGQETPLVPGSSIIYDEIVILGVERLWSPTLHEPDTIVLQFFCICDGVMKYLLQAEFEPEWARYFSQPWAPGGGSPG